MEDNEVILCNEIATLKNDIKQLESRNDELDELSSTWIQDGLKKDNTIREMKNRNAAYNKAVRELLEAINEERKGWTPSHSHNRTIAAIAAVRKFHPEESDDV